ncbi:MAG: hypothetical protein HW402_436 [Dehalococcoidales bacterium]|nr:hypothetical protein [Dehalococcoidales bacterium]
MNADSPCCPICTCPLTVSLAKGRKSGKPFVMLKCPVDGRHFRAFITDRPYVERLVNSLEATQESKYGEDR